MSIPGKSGSQPVRDALALLRADHAKVMHLFREFENLRAIDDDDDDQRKADLVDEICYELTVHTMLEQEIFYPALRARADDDDMMDEADVEHAGARDLISQLEVMYPGDDHFDATVTVLGEEVAHHFGKEESDMFEAARACGLNLDELGLRMAARKQELDEDLAAPPSSLNGIDGIDATLPREGTRRTQRPPN